MQRYKLLMNNEILFVFLFIFYLQIETKPMKLFAYKV